MKRTRSRTSLLSDFMSTNLVTASPDETLGDVLGAESNDIHELPVIERKKLVGVVTNAGAHAAPQSPAATKSLDGPRNPARNRSGDPLPEAREDDLSRVPRRSRCEGEALVGSYPGRHGPRPRRGAGPGRRRRAGLHDPEPAAVAEDDTVEHAVQIMRPSANARCRSSTRTAT